MSDEIIPARSAVIYARFSPRPNAATTQSIELQLERCRAYCTTIGARVVLELEDRAMSGKTIEDRPNVAKAVAAVCNARGVLVVYSLSRLVRCTRDALEISEVLQKNGADLISIHEHIDTTCSMGRFTFTVFAALAQMEREQMRERCADGIARCKARGKAYGLPPLGYVKEGERFVVCPSEMAVIEEAFRRHADGWVLSRVVEQMNAEGIHCRGGKLWNEVFYRIRRTLGEGMYPTVVEIMKNAPPPMPCRGFKRKLKDWDKPAAWANPEVDRVARRYTRRPGP